MGLELFGGAFEQSKASVDFFVTESGVSSRS